MVKRTHSQTGSAHVIAIIVLVVAVLGLLGFIFWQNFINKSIVKDTTITETRKPVDNTDEKAALKKYEVRTSDNFGVTFEAPTGWTMTQNTSGTLSDDETATLVSPDKFTLTIRVNRLIRGWTQDDPVYKILQVQSTSGTDLSWLVVGTDPIGLEITSGQDLPAVGSEKVAGSSIFQLGETSDGSAIYVELYGSYDIKRSYDDFIVQPSVEQAKAIIESAKILN